MDTSFPDKLKLLREKSGMTQQELADRAKINRVTLARLETGRSAPTWQSISALAAALGVSTEEFPRLERPRKKSEKIG